jgi:hypothetical protein
MQAPEVGTAYSHYYWGIDDVVVSSNENADDLAMVQLTNGDIWNVWEYRVTPMEQKIAAGDGGVLAGVLYRNNGTDNQDDVEVLVEVLSEEGDVLASVSEILPTVYSFANGLNCPANSQDTIYIATGWEPSATGNYILRSTLTSGSSTDSTPEDNTMSKVIVYTDDVYGHDDEAVLDGEMFPRESDIEGLYDPSGQGAFYHMVNGGSTAYGITVDFGSSCGLNIDGDEGELEFETRLYFYDNTVGITDSPFESAFWTYDPAWSNAGPYYLAFEDPIDLDADAVYFAAVIAEYESDGGLTVNAQLDSDTDNSTGEYNQAGDGSFVWFTSQTYSPAVRLILSERVGVDEIANLNGINLNQNIPNPASNVTTFNFDLSQSRSVQFEIRDLSGRVITRLEKGTLGAGAHTVTYDVSALSSGLYTYTLIADGVSITKKMVIR